MAKKNKKRNVPDKKNKKNITVISLITVLAALAGIWAITGYSFKDFINRNKQITIRIGDLTLKNNDTHDVLFIFPERKDKYPSVVLLPILIENDSRKDLRSIEIEVKSSSSLLKILPNDIVIERGLGFHNKYERTTGEILEFSTVSWNIDDLSSERGSLIVEQMLWSQDTKNISTPINITLSVNASNAQSSDFNIRLWSGLTPKIHQNSEFATIYDASKMKKEIAVVWCNNNRLYEAKKGINTLFYGCDNVKNFKTKKININ